MVISKQIITFIETSKEMEERELLEITPLSKGVIAFAKATKAFYGDWIILIKELEKTNYDDFLIYTHVSYCLGGKIDDANVGINDKWGDLKSLGYKFYKPTEEEVNLIKKLLKLHNKKYVKGVNKMFDR